MTVLSNPRFRMGMDPKQTYTNQNGVKLPRVRDLRMVDGDIRYHNDDGSAVQMSPEDYKRYQDGEDVTNGTGHYEGVPGSTIQGKGPDQYVGGVRNPDGHSRPITMGPGGRDGNGAGDWHPPFMMDDNGTPELSESQISMLASGQQSVTDHLSSTAMYGMARLETQDALKRGGSRMQQFGKREDKDFRPKGPGTNYLNHLVEYNKVNEKLEALRKEKETEVGNIFTDQPEAAKTALSLIGVYSEKNPGGLPIDFTEARSLWFGKKEVDGMEEASFRTTVEQGDQNIDPKRVRKFVNYDGSLTWEILNQDKTVQSRFTMGDYAGTKVFAQGGYKTFAELLKKAKKKKGPDVGGEFDAIRAGGM